MDKRVIEQYFRRGKLKTSMANVERILYRTVDAKGKVVEGEAGRQLLRRKLEKQDYERRNATR